MNFNRCHGNHQSRHPTRPGTTGGLTPAVNQTTDTTRGNQTLPKVIETLFGRPKSQVEYGTLAVCLALSGDRARAMLAKFGAVRPVFAGGMTETFIHNFTERFGD